MRISIEVNGEPREADVEPRLLLVHFLRDNLGLTGTHWACDTSNCGACTVHLDGYPVKSCTVLAVRANGHGVTTIEGTWSGTELTPMGAEKAGNAAGTIPAWDGGLKSAAEAGAAGFKPRAKG